MWYGERTEFDESQIGVKRIRHPNNGFELLQGNAVFSGKIVFKTGCVFSVNDGIKIKSFHKYLLS